MIKDKFFDNTEQYLRYCLSQCSGKLIDVGCGHGNHSLIATSMGFEVTGYDVRADRMPKDERVKWVVGDINDVDLSSYDTVLASGILYHLTFDEQILFFKKMDNVKHIIINTHFAIFNCGFPSNDGRMHMSNILSKDGYYYSIYDEGENFKTNSVGNSYNSRYVCWFDFSSLIKLINTQFSQIEICKPLLFDDRCWLIAKK